MKVKALRLGYMFDRRIYEGEVFELKDPKMFSEHWMEKLNLEKETEIKPKPKKKVKKVNRDVL